MKCYIKRQVNSADQAPLVLHFFFLPFFSFIPSYLFSIALHCMISLPLLDFHSKYSGFFKSFLYIPLSLFLIPSFSPLFFHCLSVCLLCVCLCVYVSVFQSTSLSLFLTVSLSLFCPILPLPRSLSLSSL